MANATARKALTKLIDGWKVKDTDDGHIYTYALAAGLEASDANWTSD